MSEAVEKLVNEEVEKTKRESAENMIRDGVLSVEKMAQYSGLIVDQIKELKEKISVPA